ncbi:MAG: VCBS repeat-containing protein, partial [Acidobacteria bacterium]|nr:VCBS repeat-containing protein [Acidobacteriota bacterium]
MAKWFAGVCALGLLLLLGADSSASREEELARHRNLGKAFYENPTTQKEAVEELRKALELAPGSVREQLNYGLALLRAGKTGEGIAELEKVQKHDPSLPHTWFNLGIQYKHQGDQQRAIRQFERMITLAPDDAISHYNLGALYKLAGRQPDAIRHFEIAARLDRNLAAPHFQLFNAYRAANRPADAKRELDIFQALKKQQEGAVIPEDVEWNAYAEIYDPTAAAPPAAAPATLRLTPRKLPGSAAGMAAVDRLARGRPELLIWSSAGVRLGSGVPLIALKDVTGVFPGDFNNDAFPDLCVLTDTSAALYTNVRGRFRKHAAQLPAGRYSKAVWLDYDHDYDLDLLLLGPKPVLMRNQGAAGFADRTGDFPFVQGNALDAAAFRVVANTKGMDLVVSYGERDAVLYRDLLAGKYAAEPMAVKAGATGLTPADIDNDNWIDLVFASGGQIQVLHNRNGSLKEVEAIGPGGAGFALADLDNRGVLDLVLSGSVRRNLGERKFTEPASIAALAPCRTIIPADAGGDARVDLACLTASEPQVLSNQTASKNQWIRVKLAGVKNLKLGYGSEVEVKAGSRYQKKIYQGLPLLFGLGAEKQVDTVRITWPNGLIQNEIRQVPLRLAAYREAQRLSGS